MRDTLIESRMIRGLAIASVAGLAACSDVSAPTGPMLRSTPSFAANAASPVGDTRAVIWDGSTIPEELGSLGSHSGASAIAPDGSVIVGIRGGGVGSQVGVHWVRVNGAWVIDQLPDLEGQAPAPGP